MPIVDLQVRYRELGRIRLGQKLTNRPAKLDTFRLTSPERRYIDRAAEAFGGDVKAWKSPRGDEWEVITKAKELPVVIPVQDLISGQYYELWGSPGERKAVTCLRRCDTKYDLISDRACVCDPDDRECKPTTHLLVMVRALPDIGVWRVTTHGINAARELPATVHTLAVMMSQGANIDAVLAIGHRSSTDKSGQRRHFVVPEIRIPYTTDELLAKLPDGADMTALLSGPSAEVAIGRPVLPPTPAVAALPVAPEPVPTPDDDEVFAAVETPPPLPPSPEPTVLEPPVPEPPVPEPAVVEPEPPEAETPDPSPTWKLLHAHLDVVPDHKDTMPLWEAYCRQLFTLMERLGLWKRGRTADSLHLALSAQHGVEHLTELKKAQLVGFTTLAREKALEKIGGAG